MTVTLIVFLMSYLTPLVAVQVYSPSMDLVASVKSREPFGNCWFIVIPARNASPGSDLDSDLPGTSREPGSWCHLITGSGNPSTTHGTSMSWPSTATTSCGS